MAESAFEIAANAEGCRVVNDRVEQAGFDGQYGYFTDSDAGSYFNGVDESLISLGRRYYDPGAGKFANRDPIDYAGGENLYGYAGDNPVNEVDPSGEQETDPAEDVPTAGEANADVEGNEKLDFEAPEEEAQKERTERIVEEVEENADGKYKWIYRPGWRPGMPITVLNPDGTVPAWWAPNAPAKPFTILGRYWINRSYSAEPGEFTQRQIAQMRTGFAPSAKAVVEWNKTGRIETIDVSKEVHHASGRSGSDSNQPQNLYEVWPWQHDTVDPHRNPGYTFVRWAD